MTVDFNAIPDESPTNNTSDAPMFAPIPSWERGRKRRGFGGGREAEPRTFAPAGEPDVTERPLTTGTGDAAFVAGPAFANRTRKSGGSTATVAIAAGVIVLGGLAAAGWYSMQPHGQGVAELTPGGQTTTTTTAAPDGSAASTTTTQVAQAPTPTPAPTQVAQNTPPPPVAKSMTTTTTTAHTASGGAITHRTTTVARARTASSAETTAADASTTAPVRPAPQPAAPAPAPSAAPAPAAPLVLNVPPSSAAPQAATPAPAPQTVTPPTTQAAPAPTQTPPTA